jgi:hypothetical protein
MEVEQDVFRACTACAGAVALVDGRLGCALNAQRNGKDTTVNRLSYAVGEPVTRIDCVLPRLLDAIRAEEAGSAGISELAQRVSPEWVASHARTEGPLKVKG